MPLQSTPVPFIKMRINGGADIGLNVIAFEWKSFVNGGYIVRTKVLDPYFRIVKDLGSSDSYLKLARQVPTKVEFKLGWVGGDKDPNLEMQEYRVAYLSDLTQYGTFNQAQFEFVAVDPASWFLNAGLGDGKVYKGRISDAIKEVVSDYAGDAVTVEVSETEDDKNGLWPMMRQDPKTFIQSMLDWSANLTANKTHWLTVCKDSNLYIKEQADLLSNKIHYGHFNVSKNQAKINDISDYSLITNNLLSAYQNSVITQGISAVSGKFIDSITDNDKVEIRDENTTNKLNTRTDSEKAPSKPRCKWATSIVGIPELSGGELGVKYEDYLGGRARNLYLNMLPMVMRLRIRLVGAPIFADPSKLGVSTMTLNWKDTDEQDFMLAGKWIAYGFHHKMTPRRWATDAYIYRIDHDAESRKV